MEPSREEREKEAEQSKAEIMGRHVLSFLPR